MSAPGAHREGVIRAADGSLMIPASQRPDGTWRKAVRVREGYVPQEEVPLYRTRAQQEREREEASRKPPLQIVPLKASVAVGVDSAKSKKRRRRPGATPAEAAEKPDDAVVNAAASAVADLRLEDSEKRLRRLEKKLRQIEALEVKISSGQLSQPDEDVRRKVESKAQLLQEIQQLKTG